MSLHETGMAAEVLRPGDDGYDDAARVFFATGRPDLVVRPRDADEVAAAIGYAVRHDLAVSVRSGGHSPIGHSTNTGGIVIDLAHLDEVEVLDADRRLVRVGGGATWGKVSATLDPYGFALTAGDTADVGVGGLTLGGGMGWMVRRHGLAIDNLVGARVVTADGRLVTASAEEHADLFWALRGGGGNFGVVVDFDFVAQQVSTVHYGTITYQVDDPADLLRRWRNAMRLAPEELSSTLALMPQMPGAPRMANVLLCYAGAPGSAVTDADAAIEPMLELGTVIQASIAERAYSEILEEAQHPPGVRLVGRNTLVPTLGDGVIAAIEDLLAGGGSEGGRGAQPRRRLRPGPVRRDGVRAPRRGGDGGGHGDPARDRDRRGRRAGAGALADGGGVRRRHLHQLPGLGDRRGRGRGLPTRDVRTGSLR